MGLVVPRQEVFTSHQGMQRQVFECPLEVRKQSDGEAREDGKCFMPRGGGGLKEQVGKQAGMFRSVATNERTCEAVERNGSANSRPLWLPSQKSVS